MKVEPTTYWDFQNLSEIKTLSQASKAFEEELIHTFLKEVRKSLDSSALLGSGFASKMYLDMFDMQIAKALSDGGGFGIKEYIEQAVEETYRKNSL